MTGHAAFRGQPLLLYGSVLVVWMLLRALLWQSPFASLPGKPLSPAPAAAKVLRTVAAKRETPPRSQPPPALTRPGVGRSKGFLDSSPLKGGAPSPSEPPLPPVAAPAPFAVAAQSEMQPAGVTLPSSRVARVSRWSGDGWLMLRGAGEQAAPGSLLSDRPSYGRSQAGAVIRYELAPSTGLRPRIHVRAAAALTGPREREFAAGLSARPLPGMPVRAYVEARATESEAGTRLRPAAYAVTEFPPLELPLGLRGEAYAQGGYVGGDFATAFVDGQALAERTLLRSGDVELSAGAGAWGGAQKGVARLDVGPTAAVTFHLGQVRGRIAADYRFHIAGEAEPESGPALTVSAGF